MYKRVRRLPGRLPWPPETPRRVTRTGFFLVDPVGPDATFLKVEAGQVLPVRTTVETTSTAYPHVIGTAPVSLPDRKPLRQNMQTLDKTKVANVTIPTTTKVLQLVARGIVEAKRDVSRQIGTKDLRDRIERLLQEMLYTDIR